MVMEETCVLVPMPPEEGFARFSTPGLWGSGCEEGVGRIVRLWERVVHVSEAMEGG